MEVSEDKLLGGRVRLRQPIRGYRVAIDSILLASAVPAKRGSRVLDLGAGVDRTVRMLSSMATRTLLISTDEPTSLTDAYAFIKLGSAAGMSKYVSVVVNMVQGAMEGEKTYKTLLRACENFLRIKPPLAGIVHMDSRVKDAIRSQTPILKRSPGAEAAMDVEKIARQTMRDMAEERKKMAAAGQ